MPDDHQSASRAHDDHAAPDPGELASVERSDQWQPGRHRRPRPTLVVASVLSSVVAVGVAATGVGWYLLGEGRDEPGALAASTLRPGGATATPAPTRAVRGALGSTAHVAEMGSAQSWPVPFLPAAAQRPGAAGVGLALLGLPVTLTNAVPDALPNPVPGEPAPTEVPPAKSPFVLAAGPLPGAGLTEPGALAPRTAAPGPTRSPDRPGHTEDPSPTGQPTPTGDPTAPGTPAPTDTPTPTGTPTPTSTPTKDPTPTGSPTPTDTPKPTRSPTKDPVPTATATPTKTPEPTVSPTKDPSPTATPEPTRSPTGKPLPNLPLPLPKSPNIPVPDLP
ncbi:hypothetical protein SAMN05421678_102458 [Actinopolymorpha cephalotaxi]|uniref:Uncharacterized protein n=1 Tax=Actinopolymorpha cephalotaxi TaxID=504797 RepID=A0A1I2M5E4_9ACTN|nr:hypothetical protein [Actinopolymorpha cephalotaxi]NYH81596.1 hypothetical protein [Actinopolymorpha cephalotaxi]SFF86714.1 hypothetical protein SAMN05421678_102458 [Actinopolymorpha cephalotaxi]